jgi:hypothetical protein
LFLTGRAIAEHLVASHASKRIFHEEITSFAQLGGLLNANGKIEAAERPEKRVVKT